MSIYLKKYSIAISAIMLLQFLLLIIRIKEPSVTTGILKPLYDLFAFFVFYLFPFFLLNVLVMFVCSIWFFLEEKVGLALLCLLACISYVYLAFQIQEEW